MDLFTGLYVREHDDIVLNDPKSPVTLTRTYRSHDNQSWRFGVGASHSYELWLWSDHPDDPAFIDVIMPDGARYHYVKTQPKVAHTKAVYVSTSSPDRFYGSRLRYAGQDGFLGLVGRWRWLLDFTDGAQYSFICPTAKDRSCVLNGIRDAKGNMIRFMRDDDGELLSLTSPSGSSITFKYDSKRRIIQARTGGQWWVDYTYDERGRLTRAVTYRWSLAGAFASILLLGLPSVPRGLTQEYAYDAADNMITIKEPTGLTIRNEYDDLGRTIDQALSSGFTYHFDYETDSAGVVVQTSVTYEDGHIRRVRFNPAGQPLSDVHDEGTPQEVFVTYVRDPLSDYVVRVDVACYGKDGVRHRSGSRVTPGSDFEATEEGLKRDCFRDPGPPRSEAASD